MAAILKVRDSSGTFIDIPCLVGPQGPQGPKGATGATGPAATVVNNLTSTSTTAALSAYQGNVLNAKFSSYLPLAGGAITGNTSIAANFYPSTNNARTLGTSSLKWSNVYATTFTGSMSTSLSIKQNGATTTYNGGTARTVTVPTVHSGTSAPASTKGQDGDIYILKG